MKRIILIFISLMTLGLALGAPAQSCLEVEVTNIRSKMGQLLVSLFTSPDQFPRNAPEGLKDIMISKEGLVGGSLKFEINKLPPGDYVLALLDDENNSGEMEYSRLGIPLEGFGFSNNVKPLLSTPSYSRCLFEIKEGINRIKIELQYRK